MRRLLAVGAVGIIATGLYLVLRPSLEAHATPERAAAPETPKAAAPSLRNSLAAEAAPIAQPAAAPEMLRQGTDAFYKEIDNTIPTQLYAQAAPCITPTVHRDQKVKLSYRLQIINRTVMTSQVKVMESTVSDPQVQSCILASLQNAVFPAANLPDYESDEEILIRMRGLKQHGPNRGGDEP